jgi:tetratricopeptide (TPR) repeat protein
VDKADKEFLSVVGLMGKKRWDQAIARLDPLIASADPEVADKASNFLADVYAATGRNSESEEMLRRSLEYRGADNGALGDQLACLGVVVRRQGRIDEAEEIMSHALDVAHKDDPELTAFILHNLAYLYWSKGEQERAREMYDRMPECDGDQLDFVIELNKSFHEPAVP